MPASGSNFAGLDFVHITPNPRLPGFNGAHERVLRVVEMFGGVLVLRRIAAAYVSARETQAKVNPCVAKFHALLAHVGGGGSDFYLIQVLAFLRHFFPSLAAVLEAGLLPLGGLD
jgi:hypothetical protein